VLTDKKWRLIYIYLQLKLKIFRNSLLILNRVTRDQNVIFTLFLNNFKVRSFIRSEGQCFCAYRRNR